MVVLETANLTEIEFSDLYSRKIVGWEVWKSEDAKHASEIPERWARETRYWSFSEEEWLNSRQEAETKKETKVS